MLPLTQVADIAAGDIVTPVTTTISEFLKGIGSSIADFFKTMFTSTAGDVISISTFGIVMLTFIGIGMAMGFVHLIVNKVGG